MCFPNVSSSVSACGHCDDVCLLPFQLDAVLRQFQSHTPSRSPPAWGREVVRDNIRWSERSRVEVSRWLRARLDDELKKAKQGPGAPSRGAAVKAGVKTGAKTGAKVGAKTGAKAGAKVGAKAPHVGPSHPGASKQGADQHKD